MMLEGKVVNVARAPNPCNGIALKFEGFLNVLAPPQVDWKQRSSLKNIPVESFGLLEELFCFQ